MKNEKVFCSFLETFLDSNGNTLAFFPHKFASYFRFMAIFSQILSTWTFETPPTYLTWTIMDILPTTHPPHLVHVVVE